MVCGPQGEPISEAVYFHRKLVEAELPFGGVIVNKVHYELEERRRIRRRARWPTRWPTSSAIADLAERVAANFDDYRRARRSATGATSATSRSEMRTRAVIEVPYLDDDVHDLAGLMEINRYLFASGAAERERIAASA